MSGFEDYSTALDMRDVLRLLVKKEINKNRPEPRIGVVYDFSVAGGWADILFAGSQAPLRASVSESNQPQKSVLADGDDADLVRVAKSGKSYYVCEVLTSPGIPTSYGTLTFDDILPGISDIDFGGVVLFNVADPISDQQVATKAYVDAHAGGGGGGGNVDGGAWGSAYGGGGVDGGSW